MMARYPAEVQRPLMVAAAEAMKNKSSDRVKSEKAATCFEERATMHSACSLRLVECHAGAPPAKHPRKLCMGRMN